MTIPNPISTPNEVQNNFVSSNKKIPKKVERKKKVPKSIILDLGNYLSILNYASAKSYMERADEFLKYLLTKEKVQVCSLNEGHLITQDRIAHFESYLKVRILNDEITAHTAYKKLQAVRVLCKFLDFKNITSLNYSIPKNMIHASNESNYYFESERILELINSIASSTSPTRSRDIAILLILVDTGCRPIEIANISLEDISLSERTVYLYCRKSGKRKLSLSFEVISFIKHYLDIRPYFQPTCVFLFINKIGGQLTSKSIRNIIRSANIEAFGTSKINARGLRHTYTTNALENDNDFDKVSKSLGHAHWKSTLRYLEKSKKRLKNNTLQHNPLQAGMVNDLCQ
ncbi:tyrosine-type recombinase/integrase [Bacillus mesophilum]|uniref:Tyrosine-type recombinase/integrase n=1 Tax=Bacillus mesophilum TaxID=1071718 RepID=A0A7V7RPJ7_9BACI|nr:tyrosine-type recombinase/integrase [Bacillus mesophilum]KAB2335113.1 tyrosine-type recombinase/integrase [Bacillus mesophilum]